MEHKLIPFSPVASAPFRCKAQTSTFPRGVCINRSVLRDFPYVLCMFTLVCAITYFSEQLKSLLPRAAADHAQCSLAAKLLQKEVQIRVDSVPASSLFCCFRMQTKPTLVTMANEDTQATAAEEATGSEIERKESALRSSIAKYGSNSVRTPQDFGCFPVFPVCPA